MGVQVCLSRRPSETPSARFSDVCSECMLICIATTLTRYARWESKVLALSLHYAYLAKRCGSASEYELSPFLFIRARGNVAHLMFS